MTKFKTQTRSVKGTNLLLAIFDTNVEVFTSAIYNFDAVLCNASKNPQYHKNLYTVKVKFLIVLNGMLG